MTKRKNGTDPFGLAKFFPLPAKEGRAATKRRDVPDKKSATSEAASELKGLTHGAARDELSHRGLTIGKTGVGEDYRVTFRHMPKHKAEGHACYANDLADALATGRHMAAWKENLNAKGLQSNGFDVDAELAGRAKWAAWSIAPAAKSAVIDTIKAHDWKAKGNDYWQVVKDFDLHFMNGDYGRTVAVHAYKDGRTRTDTRLVTFEKRGGQWKPDWNFDFNDRTEFDLNEGDWEAA